jgi:hypothetical protein
MGDEHRAIEAAERYLGPEAGVRAAGVFGLQDDYAAIAVAGAATGLALGAAGADDPVTAGLTAGVTVHATRDAVAKDKGLTVRMLVAVTDDAIHILDYPDSDTPTCEFMRFDRATCTVQITKFGASRHLNLADHDGEQQIGLTGSTSFLSSVSGGDKAVLGLLGM